MTKTIANLTIAAALTLAAAGSAAESSYDTFTAGNPDVAGSRSELRDVVAVQPGIGSDLDRYQGIADGNSDLQFDVSDAMSKAHEAPRIYGNFGGNPDLQF